MAATVTRASTRVDTNLEIRKSDPDSENREINTRVDTKKASVTQIAGRCNRHA